jgi:WD40 repeat protein
MNLPIGKISLKKKRKLPSRQKRKQRVTVPSTIFGALIFLLLITLAYKLPAQELETVIQKGHELSVLSVAVSPDSNYVVTTSRDKSAKLWDVRNGREVRSFLGHQASVTSAAFSPDGKILLTGSNDKSLKLWDIGTGKEIFSIETIDYITSVAIDPLQRFFVYAGYNDTGYGDTATVFEWKSRKVLAKLPANPDKGLGSGVDISISRDGKLLALGEDNRTVTLYETTSWKQHSKIEYPEGFCGGCGTMSVFAPDNKHLIFVSHRGFVKKYDLQSNAVVQELGGAVSELKGLALSSDGKYVGIATEDKTVVLNTSSGDTVSTLKAEEKAKFRRIAFSLNADRLFVACDNNTLIQWKYREGKLLPPLTGFLTEQDNGGLNYDPNFYWESHIAKYIRYKNSILVSRDGKSLIKGRFGTRVRQWDIATGKSIMDFVGHKKAVLAYDLSRNGKLLLTGGGDGKIVLWDFATGDSLKVIQSYREPIFDIHFSNDEKKILSSSWDGTMKIHDIEKAKLESLFTFENGSAYSVLYHPNDLYVFTARLDNSLQLWEVDTRSVVRTFTGHTGIVSALDVTQDQKTLLSGSWDGSVRLWDIASGLMSKKIVHSTTAVHCAMFSPDEKSIISAGADRLIKFWDASSGSLLKVFSGHNGEITSLTITNDSKMLISHSVDGVTKFWNLESGKEFFEHIHIGDHDWLVKNKEGYFNGTDGARKYVHFVKGIKTYNVDQFFDDFYRPDLLPKIFQTRGGNDNSKGIENKLQKSPPPTVKVALLPMSQGKVQLLVRMLNSGTGVRTLRIQHNGKSIVIKDDEVSYPGKAGESTTFKKDIDLIGGNNTFTVVASNNDNVESDPRSVEFFTESAVKHSTCHVFAVGINEYKNSKLNLNYAKSDAVSFSGIVNDKSAGLFHEIRVHTLYDKEASRANILAKLDELSREIHPEDVFIFYYAGHGSMVDNKFYFIPTENLRLYDAAGLQKEAIEAGIIQGKLQNIQALKQLIVMDACQSGGSVELLATRGASEEKAIAQLSRSTGVHVLASAGSEQFATEFTELGHGLFTYVLMKALEGEADGAPRDGKVTIYELKSYIDDQVPEMTRKLKGKPQYPYTFSRGQDFPVVIKP